MDQLIATWHIIDDNWRGGQSLFEVDALLPDGVKSISDMTQDALKEHIQRIRQLIRTENFRKARELEEES